MCAASPPWVRAGFAGSVIRRASCGRRPENFKIGMGLKLEIWLHLEVHSPMQQRAAAPDLCRGALDRHLAAQIILFEKIKNIFEKPSLKSFLNLYFGLFQASGRSKIESAIIF